jgi:hypothetical protein
VAGSLARRPGLLVIDAYRMNRITAHQLCRVLDIPSRCELDGFLKQHGVPRTG